MGKIKRPDILYGMSEKIKTGCGNLYITINEYEGKLFEVRLRLGKPGACANAWVTAFAEILTRYLQVEEDITEIKELIKELKGIMCNENIISNGIKIGSCPDAISIVFEKYLNNRQQEEEKKDKKEQKEESSLP